MLRGLQDWWDRREAMRVLAELQRAEAAGLAQSEQNPLLLAVKALQAENLELAAAHWEDARNRVPEHVMKSEDSIKILLGLQRLDELEALMMEGHRKAPRVVLYKLGLAQVNERRHRFAEAAKWWSSIRVGSPNGIETWIREAYCLERAEQLDASAEVLFLAARHFPNRSDAWSKSARIYEKVQRWPEALKAWDYVAETLKDGSGYAGGARVCAHMGDSEGAAQRLNVGYAKFPYSFDLLQTLAEVREQEGDLPGAIKFWAEVRLAHPQLETGYREGIRCLLLAGEADQAEQVFAQAEKRFPGKLIYPP